MGSLISSDIKMGLFFFFDAKVRGVRKTTGQASKEVYVQSFHWLQRLSTTSNALRKKSSLSSLPLHRPNHACLTRCQGRDPEIWIRGGVKEWGLVSSPSLSPPLPSPSPPTSRPLPVPPVPFPSLPSPPLRSRPLNPARGSGSGGAL